MQNILLVELLNLRGMEIWVSRINIQNGGALDSSFEIQDIFRQTLINSAPE